MLLKEDLYCDIIGAPYNNGEAMNNFEEYLRQGEPDKTEKAKAWRTAIGLQQVDGLTPSSYLINAARLNIEGDISIQEVQDRLEVYYVKQPSGGGPSGTEEADKVSARIAEILSENTFTFSPAEYLSIHWRLFHGLYDFAGKIRDYNITKNEWVLNGDTVLYAGAASLKATLEFDLEQEKRFSYRGLSKGEIVEHIAHFVAQLWQIHVFGEGNTRTTAIFLIKYLQKLGFKQVNNDLFAEHSWYFRNALVRANYEDLSKGIYKTEEYIIRFLFNLVLNERHDLKNRHMHIHFIETFTHENDTANSKKYTVNAKNDTVNPKNDTVNPKNDTVNPKNDTVNPKGNTLHDNILSIIKDEPSVTAAEISDSLGISISTAKRRLKQLREKGLIVRVGSDKKGFWEIIQTG